MREGEELLSSRSGRTLDDRSKRRELSTKSLDGGSGEMGFVGEIRGDGSQKCIQWRVRRRREDGVEKSEEDASVDVNEIC